MEIKKSSWVKDPRLSEVTLTILKQLIELKNEKKACQRKMLTWSFIQIFVLMGSLLFIFIGNERILPTGNQFSLSIGSPLLVFLLLLNLSTYMRFFIVKKAFEKTEEEYENLRVATINRSLELWLTDEQWDARHLVFEYLQGEHDINLYYE